MSQIFGASQVVLFDLQNQKKLNFTNSFLEDYHQIHTKINQKAQKDQFDNFLDNETGVHIHLVDTVLW